MKNEETQNLAEIGGRIRKVREASGLNLHELALLSGVSAPALSLIENGKRDLRLTSLFRIAGALRISVGDLFDERPTDAPIPSGEGYDLKDYT